jgi:hypothetical protein
MKQLLVAIAGAIFVCAVTSPGGQAPVSPVVPKQPQTVETYEKTLGSLLKADADDKLWELLDAAKLRELLNTVEAVNQDIQALPIGPVPPKATPKPPVSAVTPKPPVTPKPGPGDPKPTKEEFDDALEDLQETLQRTTKLNPQAKLPQKEDREIRRVLEMLTKGSPQ